MKKLQVFISVFTLLMIAIFSTAPVHAETSTITVHSSRDMIIAPEMTFGMDILVSEATDLIGFQTMLVYDDTMFTFDNIVGSTALGGAVTINSTTSGELLINYVDINTKLNGEVVLFTLYFTANQGITSGDYGVISESVSYYHEFITLDSENNLAVIDDVLFDFPGVRVGQYGDVDFNEMVTISDVALIQLHMEGLITLSETKQALADINHDDVLDLTDAAQIQLYIAGLITTLEPQ
ncbi:dockerin type I repeat-containing protein [Candidatus Xianfuyuplasma coldseepsis]|uniref:Dockerin domain-containing protein n=1 Tax=Candidatus Xianfuyuplasma coldseepsis TaxID=2782163 RepID=A0A7L7KR35_9MOLU|nr:dockerin type I repeat-containing protein [Xianfuyuplasma coldseepsis]QMS85147.1 hypothetical protein G4Z02_05105 [Xianfuyuplasma coldseepsis]